MKRNKARSKKGSPSLIGPFMVPDASGLGMVMPAPLTSGPPEPEPEERWTLGPGTSVPAKDKKPDAAPEPPTDPSGPSPSSA